MATKSTLKALEGLSKLRDQVVKCNCSHCRWLMEQAWGTPKSPGPKS